ncbi:MAG: chemotaxis protein CheC [Deltaproteobacteria bacterium]|nr:chemotaxis protein CheC [Deltaproteobacteria bacterium]
MTGLSTRGLDEAQVDRFRELTSIGAGHAANALAAMVGRPCSMDVPTVLAVDAVPDLARDAQHDDPMGVFFELQGGPGGRIALIFPGEVRDRLVQLLVGGRSPDSEMAESALRELGNILVSHVASSIGETTGTLVVPSVPELVLHDAEAAFANRLQPGEANAGLRIETELGDRAGEIHGRLVYVPAPHEG